MVHIHAYWQNTHSQERKCLKIYLTLKLTVTNSLENANWTKTWKESRIGICTAGVSPSLTSPTLNWAVRCADRLLSSIHWIHLERQKTVDFLSWKHVRITHCTTYGSHLHFIVNKSLFNGLYTDTQQFRLLLSVRNFVIRSFPRNFLKLVSKCYLASNFIVLTSTK